jgi:hypothetical protein
MGAIQVKTPSTQGTRSRLARAQPQAGTVDPGGFTLGQIASPTDRIAGAFNARIA